VDVEPALFSAEPAPAATPGLFDDVPDLTVAATAAGKVGRVSADRSRPEVQRGLFELALVDTGEGQLGLVIDE
jgi:hypothetical protein